MRKVDLVTLNGIEIKVKELTVGEVRHWMMDALADEINKNAENHPHEKIPFVLDQGFLQEIGLTDIMRMTDISTCQLDGFTPSELNIVIQKCKELNPDFFVLRNILINRALNKV